MGANETFDTAIEIRYSFCTLEKQDEYCTPTHSWQEVMWHLWWCGDTIGTQLTSSSRGHPSAVEQREQTKQFTAGTQGKQSASVYNKTVVNLHIISENVHRHQNKDICLKDLFILCLRFLYVTSALTNGVISYTCVSIAENRSESESCWDEWWHDMEENKAKQSKAAS